VRHADIGREVIQGARSWGAQIHLAAQDHHERLNGSGYPRGRRAKEIDPRFPDGRIPRLFRGPDLSPSATGAVGLQPGVEGDRRLTEMGTPRSGGSRPFPKVFTDLPRGELHRPRGGRSGVVVGMDPGIRRDTG